MNQKNMYVLNKIRTQESSGSFKLIGHDIYKALKNLDDMDETKFDSNTLASKKKTELGRFVNVNQLKT